MKNPPAKQGMWVWSLGWEDPLEKEIATISSILAWEIPWKDKPGMPQPARLQKSWTQLSDWTELKLEMARVNIDMRLKHLPPMWETQVRSLGQEDPLEKEMATHSSILAWRIPWTEELGRLQSTGLQRVGHDWVTSLHFQKLYRTQSMNFP